MQEGRFETEIAAVGLTFKPRMEAYISGSARSDFPRKLCWFPPLKKESCKEGTWLLHLLNDNSQVEWPSR